VGRRDPKRIHRSLRITQNVQRQFMMLRLASTDNKRKKNKNSQNTMKMA